MRNISEIEVVRIKRITSTIRKKIKLIDSIDKSVQITKLYNCQVAISLQDIFEEYTKKRISAPAEIIDKIRGQLLGYSGSLNDSQCDEIMDALILILDSLTTLEGILTQSNNNHTVL